MINLSPEERNKARKEWNEKCRLAKEAIKLDPMDYYVTLIRGRQPWFELSYEDEQARIVQSVSHDTYMIDSMLQEHWFLREKPQEMTMEEWKKEKKRLRACYSYSSLVLSIIRV